MKAMVMAGGFGTRLRPLTCNVPKPMALMANRPMLAHIFDLLKKYGITDIVVALYFQPEIITEYFGDGSALGLSISYLLPDADLGTAGCVKKAEPLLDGERFIVLSGDVLTNIDLSSVIQYHETKKAEATIVLQQVENPLAFGVVITDEQDRITRFLEKPNWGEVFSDMVNTGIYVLENSVLGKIPPNQDYDFSKQLFPNMLEEAAALFGYKSTRAYWRDIGNLTEYRLAHYDILAESGMEKSRGLQILSGLRPQIGKDCVIDPTAQIEKDVVVGDRCTVGPRVRLANTVLGNGCEVAEGAKVIGCIVWDRVRIGREVNLKEVTIANDCQIGDHAYIGVGAVIADHCRIGQNVTVKAEVKVWPYKEIEDDTTLSTSLIWGERWSKRIFDAYGVSALGNIEMTPEFAAKLGAAYGAAIGKGNYVVASRDIHKSSRMIERAIMSGLTSVGVNIHDLRSVPIPVARYAIPTLKSMGGFHVRKSPYNERVTDIKFFDDRGKEVSGAKEKGIENLFFREDFPRVSLEGVGEISFPPRAMEYYQEGFMQNLDLEPIRNARFKVVIDYCWGSGAEIFPHLLGRMECEVMALNSYPDGSKLTRTHEEKSASLHKLSEIVTSLKADLGIMLDAGAQKISIVDNLGRVLNRDQALALMVLLVLKSTPKARIAVPMAASRAIDELVQRLHGTLVRTQGLYTALLEKAAQEPRLDFVGELKGGYVFPAFQPAFDAMMASAKLLELLAKSQTPLSELVDEIPSTYLIRRCVPCSWEHKGMMMRKVMEDAKGQIVELIEGVKIWQGKSWVMITPDPDKPVIHILAEGHHQAESEQLAARYEEKLHEWLNAAGHHATLAVGG